jgi:glucose-1-phosphate thymidylyltransferase
MQERDADLVLGIFPTNEASNFAPTEFEVSGKVLNIWEKPAVPEFDNTWGIAVWNKNFWDYFKLRSNDLEPGISITDIFDKAAKSGLNVFSVYFEDGWYKDVGRINNISIMG